MYNIRRRSFGEILDTAFQVLRDHFVLLAGISAVVGIPAGMMMAVKPGDHFAIAICGILFSLIFTPVRVVAFTIAVASVYLDRPVTIGEAYRAVGGVFKPVIGTALLADLLMLLGFIALIVPAIYLGICWSLIYPVMIVEHRFGMVALSRSRQLVSGAWWKTLGIVLVAALIATIPAVVLRMLWSSIPVLGPLVTATTSSIAGAYSLAMVVIYYFDRRCRIEDFDLRLLAEQIRAEGASGTLEMAQPAPAN
jgi:hypothetical protein